MVLDKAPWEYDFEFKVSGTGWHADNEVTIRYPEWNFQKRTFEWDESSALVSDGKFSYPGFMFFLQSDKHYSVIVRGEQSGHEESERFFYVRTPLTTTTVGPAFVP